MKKKKDSAHEVFTFTINSNSIVAELAYLLLLHCTSSSSLLVFLRRLLVEESHLFASLAIKRIEIHTIADSELPRLEQIVARERRYKRFLMLGARTQILQRLFAKSRREIEKDRRLAGIANTRRGRRRAITGTGAYEVYGIWQSLKSESRDLAESLELLHKQCDSYDIDSLYDAVTKWG